MLKETFTYTNFNDVEVTETVRFNLTQAEIAEMELSSEGGMVAMLEHIVETKDTPKLMETFKKIILAAYGEVSPDGRRFIKSEEMGIAFSQTPMYDELLVKLLTVNGAADAFMRGIMPKELTDAQKQRAAIENLNNNLKAVGF